jgi:hypothetical protein
MRPTAPPGDDDPPSAGRVAPLNASPLSGIVTTMPEHTMNYIETEAPAGLTLIDWQRSRVQLASRRRRIRLTPPRIRPAFAF